MEMRAKQGRNTLEELHQQCDAEAALAEVNIYEAVASQTEGGRMSANLSPPADPLDCTSQ